MSAGQRWGELQKYEVVKAAMTGSVQRPQKSSSPDLETTDSLARSRVCFCGKLRKLMSEGMGTFAIGDSCMGTFAIARSH
jgi:cytochrome c-type biogenesis protein CcmE